MTPKISVIVPVYNTGEILRKTLDSILFQTFKEFELIIIDDGSNDVSIKICDEYAAKDARVIVIHQKNAGICAARNTGIKIAKAKYLTFCDHDDLYDPRKLEVQYNLAIHYNADIVNVGYKTVSDVSQKSELIQMELVCHDRNELKNHILDITYLQISTIWNKLYNAEKLRDIFYFNEDYTKGHEDINFNLMLLQHVEVFVSSKEVLYEHIQRKMLSTSAKIHKETLYGMKTHIKNFMALTDSFHIDMTKNNILYYRNLSMILRVYAVYSIKADLLKTSFLSDMKDLHIPYTHVLWHKFHKEIPIKDLFVLWCIIAKQYRLLYFALKCYVSITKI